MDRFREEAFCRGSDSAYIVGAIGGVDLHHAAGSYSQHQRGSEQCFSACSNFVLSTAAADDVRVCVCICVCVHVYVNVCVRTQPRTQRMCACVYVCTSACAF